MVGIIKVGEMGEGKRNLGVREHNEEILSVHFRLGNFRRRKFFKWGKVVTTRF